MTLPVHWGMHGWPQTPVKFMTRKKSSSSTNTTSMAAMVDARVPEFSREESDCVAAQRSQEGGVWKVWARKEKP